MEEVSVVETAEYKSPSIGDMLKQAQTKEAPKEPDSPAPSEEVSEEKTEAPPKEVPEEPNAPKPEEAPKPVETPALEASKVAEEKMVPLSALRAERERRKAADAALMALRAQGLSTEAPQAQPETQTANWEEPVEAVTPSRSNFELLASEKLARLEHSDYDEKYKAFEEHAAEALKAGDKALINSVLASDHPGEAAYVAGRMLLEGKKYGFDVLSDPNRYREAIRKDLEAQIRSELGQKEKATVSSRISDRSKTPTDIALAKSSSGSSVAEYHSPSMSEFLARYQNSRKRF